ncbi:Major sperm protein [Caenorhabditis elegans]|uniref:Major sperm protein n=1 Tax=Caenorhabditis elegans TaxID=6239 RepID=Q21500_CAEEL|nr:Major sperm protein [Caenorhabditis elegans]CCD68243.1 Major sperm protein [Caenorhabditis elegans]|eukprot:NP_504485.1 Major sperm protein [Caenorhabditis elegans]
MSSSTTDDDSCSYFFFRQACLIPTPSVPTHPSVSIKIYPPFAEFIDFGGASRHILTNNGTCRIVFKVKCSNNLVFKVSPVYAFLDPGATAELQVLRREGPPKHDKLIISLKEAKKGDKDPRVTFNDSTHTTHKHILPLLTRIVEEQ